MNGRCYNCGSADLKPLYGAPAFDCALHHTPGNLGLARCTDCDLVCTTGVAGKELAETYDGEYYGSAKSKFLPLIERTLLMFKRRQAQKIIRLWQRGQAVKRAPSVLDIGCGRGQLLRAFQSIGASVLGLERDEFPVDELPGNIVRTGSLSDPEYAGVRFDIIILWHVFEHLEHHDTSLQRFAEHLNENGLLIIAVPNFASLQQRLFTRYWFHLDLPRHLAHLESQWLEQRLMQHGFTIENLTYLDTLQNSYGFIQSTQNAMAPSRMNSLYRLLKHGLSLRAGTLLPLLLWGSLAALIAPIALLENVLGNITKTGATVQIMARKERKS